MNIILEGFREGLFHQQKSEFLMASQPFSQFDFSSHLTFYQVGLSLLKSWRYQNLVTLAWLWFLLCSCITPSSSTHKKEGKYHGAFFF